MATGKIGSVAKVASSAYPFDKLLSHLQKIGTAKQTVQVFDPNAVINKTHLDGAFFNAIEAFKDGTNISNSLGMEMLLFAAMTSQIDDAIKIAGAKSGKEFVIFASSAAMFNRAKQYLKSSKDFKPSVLQQAKTAKRYGITQRADLDHFILQKITLSRLSD